MARDDLLKVPAAVKIGWGPEQPLLLPVRRPRSSTETEPVFLLRRLRESIQLVTDARIQNVSLSAPFDDFQPVTWQAMMSSLPKKEHERETERFRRHIRLYLVDQSHQPHTGKVQLAVKAALYLIAGRLRLLSARQLELIGKHLTDLLRDTDVPAGRQQVALLTARTHRPLSSLDGKRLTPRQRDVIWQEMSWALEALRPPRGRRKQTPNLSFLLASSCYYHDAKEYLGYLFRHRRSDIAHLKRRLHRTFAPDTLPDLKNDSFVREESAKLGIEPYAFLQVLRAVPQHRWSRAPIAAELTGRLTGRSARRLEKILVKL